MTQGDRINSNQGTKKVWEKCLEVGKIRQALVMKCF